MTPVLLLVRFVLHHLEQQRHLKFVMSRRRGRRRPVPMHHQRVLGVQSSSSTAGRQNTGGGAHGAITYKRREIVGFVSLIWGQACRGSRGLVTNIFLFCFKSHASNSGVYFTSGAKASQIPVSQTRKPTFQSNFIPTPNLGHAFETPSGLPMSWSVAGLWACTRKRT